MGLPASHSFGHPWQLAAAALASASGGTASLEPLQHHLNRSLSKAGARKRVAGSRDCIRQNNPK